MTTAALAIAEAVRVMRSKERAYLNYIACNRGALDHKIARMIALEFKVARTIPASPELNSYEAVADFVSARSKQPCVENLCDTAKSIFASAENTNCPKFRKVWQAEKKNGRARRCYSAISKLYMFATDMAWPPFDKFAADAVGARGRKNVPRAEDFYQRLQRRNYADRVAKVTCHLSDIEDARAQRVIDKYLMMTQIVKMKDWAKMWLEAEPEDFRQVVHEAGAAIDPILKGFLTR